jgi:hypothetical protein
MTEQTYVRFTENCDWEGESWNFYLPTEGNEEALAWLRGLVADGDVSNQYEVGEETYTQAEVATLARSYSQTTYLQEHTVLSGRLATGYDMDALYKGGIRDQVSGL